jgi:hypothetical protein
MSSVEPLPPLPNLIIAGAPKCGTTSLFDYLVQHPQVGGSSVKETCYFMDRGYPLFKAQSNYLDHGMEGYQGYFAHLDPQRPKLICEATPDYLYQQSALEHIADLPGDVTILFMLRHPADRAYSMFRFAQHNIGVIPKKFDFTDFLDDLDRHAESYAQRLILRDLLRHGYYHTYLRNWKARYGDRMQVYLFEEMAADPRGFMQRLAQRLDIDPDYYATAPLGVENSTVRVRFQPVHRLYRRLRRRDWLRALPMAQSATRFYRRFNVEKSGRSSRSDRDQQRLTALSRCYQTEMTLIEQEFGLDLTAWRRRYGF